ncbi:hypothetical protein [Dongia mobilis]|jgi:hypothetical protein|uniref:hypothetical protein n=1 Tax=Dongia sp. TaxID=1977262 RepID=UPI0026F0F6E7
MIERIFGLAPWLALAYLGFGISSAQAYLDPGTGSIILQAVIGAVTGALIVIKLYWYKLKQFFKGDGKNGADEGGDKGRS